MLLNLPPRLGEQDKEFCFLINGVSAKHLSDSLSASYDENQIIHFITGLTSAIKAKKGKIENPILSFFCCPHEELIKHIGEHKRASLLQSVLELIGVDASIPDQQKQTFTKLSKEKPLTDFLAEVYIFALPRTPLSASKQKAMSLGSATIPYLLTPSAASLRIDHILGRDEYVDDLCDKLEQGNPLLQLVGMDGIGKSTILHMVYACFADDRNAAKRHFKHIAFLTIENDFDAAIAGLPLSHADGGIGSAWLNLQRLCDKSRVLLLIDDNRQDKRGSMTEPDEAFQRLLSLHRAAILLASRSPIEGFEPLDVPTLPTETCVDIYKMRRFRMNTPDNLPPLKWKDTQLLKGIIERRAGNNTLLVDRLGSMALAHNWSVSKLENALDTKDFHIRKSYKSHENLQDEIAKLYSLNDIASLADMSVLEAFAILSTKVLYQDESVEWLREDAGVNEDECCLLLERLRDETWLASWRGWKANYFMHQLVRAAVIEQMDIKLENHRGLIRHCIEAITLNGLRTYYDVIVRGSITCAEALGNFFFYEDHMEIATLLSWLGRHAVDTGDFAQAMRWLERARSIYNELLNEETLEVAGIIHNMARCISGQSKNEEALEMFQRARAIREGLFGTEQLATAESYQGIGEFYSKSDYAEALSWFTRARDIRQKLLPEGHMDICVSCRSMAEMYMQLSDYRKSRESYSEAFQHISFQYVERGKDSSFILYDPDVQATFDGSSELYKREKQRIKELKAAYRREMKNRPSE